MNFKSGLVYWPALFFCSHVQRSEITTSDSENISFLFARLCEYKSHIFLRPHHHTLIYWNSLWKWHSCFDWRFNFLHCANRQTKMAANTLRQAQSLNGVRDQDENWEKERKKLECFFFIDIQHIPTSTIMMLTTTVRFLTSAPVAHPIYTHICLLQAIHTHSSVNVGLLLKNKCAPIKRNDDVSESLSSI